MSDKSKPEQPEKVLNFAEESKKPRRPKKPSPADFLEALKSGSSADIKRFFEQSGVDAEVHIDVVSAKDMSEEESGKFEEVKEAFEEYKKSRKGSKKRRADELFETLDALLPDGSAEKLQLENVRAEIGLRDKIMSVLEEHKDAMTPMQLHGVLFICQQCLLPGRD